MKDGTYSYSKDKGYVEAKVEKPFTYFTQIKVDSTNERAVQKIWNDATLAEPISTAAIDFQNARMMIVDYEEGTKPGLCKIYQY